jgi:uncharacterized membrane protein YccC
MTKMGKRIFLGRGKGYISAAGPQYRFIVFLIFILVAYTLLLRVFQKLAEILQLPIFLPISLIILLIFIGIIGTLYSHKFVGPMARIRRALEQMVEGENAISLRLRESDDPMLKDIVKSISRLCEHARNEHILIQDRARDLYRAVQALHDEARKSGACSEQLEKHFEGLLKKQEQLEQTIKSFHKG